MLFSTAATLPLRLDAAAAAAAAALPLRLDAAAAAAAALPLRLDAAAAAAAAAETFSKLFGWSWDRAFLGKNLLWASVPCFSKENYVWNSFILV